MKPRTAILVLAASAVALSAAAARQSAEPPKPTAERFAKLKTLVGEWRSADDDKDGKPDHIFTYRLTGAGSALLETISPGTEHEMVTMYTIDGKDIVLTHYCALGNQPRMKAGAGDDTTFSFAFASLGNGDAATARHMHDMTMTFTDADHIKAAWRLFENGKPAPEHAFELARAPK